MFPITHAIPLHRPICLLSLLWVLGDTVPLAHAQEWRSYGGDKGGMKYSSLSQIHKKNVEQLEVAWTHDTGDFSDRTIHPARSAFECTPLVVDGVMYVTTPFDRLLALDPDTGSKLWEFDPKFDFTHRIYMYRNRGVAYWSDNRHRRIFLGDQKGRLFAIDAHTGQLEQEFGQQGMIDLAKGILDEFPNSLYGLTSPVAVCGNVLVVGGFVSDLDPQGPSGDIRAFDARTGEQLWRFRTVPRPGEFGSETWHGDSWKNRSGVNAWSIISVDEQNHLVFVPLTSPGYDFFGGDRKGANLFSDSVVALDCQTGKRRWHFQTIHHDLWDWDLPAQPNLVVVMRDNSRIPAVAQVTKTGFVFLLDRLTGKPLFEVQERPVPRSKVPGEWSAPTQPIPVRPPPFARQSMTADEITNVTPESRQECMEIIKDVVVDGPMYRPIGLDPTVIFPGSNGGANWGGSSFDPQHQVLYVNSMDSGSLFRMVERPADASVPFRVRGTKTRGFKDSNGYPCQKPPWGTLTAIDLNTGQFRWQVTLGEREELTKRGVPKTGTQNIGGSIVTAGGVVFIGATNDRRFRAFDKDSGRELWSTLLPASGFATPMTYRSKKTNKQYVVIAAGGGNVYDKAYSGKLLAFALPSDER